MAAHTPGASALVSGKSHANPEGAASKERYVYGVLAALEQEENLLTRVADRTDSINITANLSTQIASVNVVLNVTASNAANGNTSYTATHYLVASTFASGTGGDSTAANLTQAVMEGIISLKILELDPTKKINPEKTVITRCTHTLAASGGTNATFAATLEFPIEIISLPGGGSVIEGKTFLN